MRFVERLYPERYSPRWQYNFIGILYLLAAVSLVFLALFVVQYVQSRSDARDAVQLDVWTKADKAARAVGNWFESARTAISELGEELKSDRQGPSGSDGDLSGLVRDVPSVRVAGYFEAATTGNPDPMLVVYRRPSDRQAT